MPQIDLTLTDSDGALLQAYSEAGASFSSNASFVFQGNRVFSNYTASDRIEIVDLTTASTFSLTLNLHRVTDAGNMGVLICADATGDNSYMVRVKAGRGIDLWVVTAGSFSLLDSYTFPDTGNDSAVPEIVIHATATHINIDVDGTQQITEADTTHARSGRVFLRANLASTATTGYHLSSMSFSDASVPADFIISNIDGDNTIYEGQTSVVVTLTDDIETVPTSEPTSWYATYGGVTLTPVSWNSGNPTFDIPIDTGLNLDTGYPLEVGYTV